MRFDILIHGGGIKACVRAVEYTKRGYSVILIEKRTFLGADITSFLKPWEFANACDAVKKEFAEYFPEINIRKASNTDIKRFLHMWLKKNGVSVYFDLHACALYKNADEVSGVLFASKDGYMLAEADYIIDAEASAPVMRMITNEQVKHQKKAHISICCRRLDTNNNPISELAEHYCYDGDTYFDFSYEINENDSNDTILIKGHKAVYEGLLKLKAAFKDYNFNFTGISYEPYAEIYPLQNMNLPDNIVSLQTAIEEPECIKKSKSEVELFFNRQIKISADKCDEIAYEPYDERLPFRRFNIKFSDISAAEGYDVIVAGGGTAGVPAAIAASRSGAKTVVIEKLPSTGGTQTLGRVSGGFYHGVVDGFAALQNENLSRFCAGNGAVSRTVFYSLSLTSVNADIISNAIICDVVKNGTNISGVIFVSDGKWKCINGKVIVDATGDGDIIALADVKFSLGSEKDGNLQDSSQWDICGMGYDLDVIDQSQYSELMRGNILAHYMSREKDFSPMLCPREGRLFEGEYVLGLDDVILERKHDDTICVASTDNDPHGGMSSVMSLMGLTPYHGEVEYIEIPYRSCIPKGLDNLLAASKSISASRDAAAYLRMAADVQNKGYAIGTAAALAVKYNSDVRAVPMQQLKSILKLIQIIPNRIGEEKVSCSLNEMILQLSVCEHKAMKKIMSMPKEDILPEIRGLFKDEPDNIAAALILGYFGDKSGLELIKSSLKHLSENEVIDDYTDIHPHKPGNNIGGILDSVSDYWRINQILTVLSLLEEPAPEEDIINLINNFTSGGIPYRDESVYVRGRVDLHKIPHYDRAKCLAYYIDKMPSRAYCEPLENLMKKENISGFISSDFCTDSGNKYQSAYLEATLYAILAKCGSKKGIEGLKRAMKDVHYTIRKKAYENIESLK